MVDGSYGSEIMSVMTLLAMSQRNEEASGGTWRSAVTREFLRTPYAIFFVSNIKRAVALIYLYVLYKH